LPAALELMVAAPLATAVTNPLVLTVATARFEDDQVSVVPATTAP
jgi:hypothetical protein